MRMHDTVMQKKKCVSVQETGKGGTLTWVRIQEKDSTENKGKHERREAGAVIVPGVSCGKTGPAELKKTKQKERTQYWEKRIHSNHYENKCREACARHLKITHACI